MSVRSIPEYNSPREDRILTRDEVKARFDRERATVYSRDNPRYLPDFANAFALVVASLQDDLPSAPRLLDLGAGTGNLSRRVLAALPGSHVTLLDFSPNMLAGTATVLADYRGRYETICGDFFDVALPEDQFDGVISSFALHHGRGEDEYQRLYERIRRCLKSGGVFACCDVVDGATAHWTTLNENGWKDYLRAADYSEEEITRLFESYYVEDTPLSLARHLALLQTVGFCEVDVLWKCYNFAVYCAQV